MALSLVVVGAFVISMGSWREYGALTRREVAIAVGAGAMLALHFWSWIASLQYTTVAASVVLVNLHPVVIVTGSALWLGERPGWKQVAGIVVAMLGAAIVALGDAGASTAGANPVLGDLLAFVGALTVGVYYLVGRSLRQRLTLWPYLGLVFGACLVSLLLLAWGSGAQLWPQPAREVWIFAAIALGPMLMGHGGFNWALRYVPAYLVSLAVLVEPVGATIFAALIPAIRETPGISTLVGGAVALSGLAVGTLSKREGS